MFAVDTSSLSAYLSNVAGFDVEALQELLGDEPVFLPPVVLSEVMSFPGLDQKLIKIVQEFPLLSIEENYWKRVGVLRLQAIQKGFKAKIADTMIAQSCIDHDAILITRDSDFKIFEKIGGLKLYQNIFH